MKISSKCFRNKAKIDAKPHDKSMPKLATKEIIKVIKNQFFFFRMVKSCKFIVTTMVFEGLTSCVREQGFHQKFIKKKAKSILKSM